MGCVYLIFVYPSKYHNCNCILTSDLKPFIILRRSRLLNYVFRRFLRVIIDMYQGLRICFLMCVNTISLIPRCSLWMSRTSFIFKAIMYARKTHRNFYHLSEPLHIYLPALLHLFYRTDVVRIDWHIFLKNILKYAAILRESYSLDTIFLCV